MVFPWFSYSFLWFSTTQRLPGRHGTVGVGHVGFPEAPGGAAQAQHGAGQGALADPGTLWMWKTMGKPWENWDFMGFYGIFYGMFYGVLWDLMVML